MSEKTQKLRLKVRLFGSHRPIVRERLAVKDVCPWHAQSIEVIPKDSESVQSHSRRRDTPSQNQLSQRQPKYRHESQRSDITSNDLSAGETHGFKATYLTSNRLSFEVISKTPNSAQRLSAD